MNGKAKETGAGVGVLVRCLFLLCTLLLLDPGRLAAQVSSHELSSGTRIRVSAPEILNGRVIGRVAELDSGSLTVAVGEAEDQISLPLSAITSLERSLGRSRGASARRGAVVGLVAGVGLGVVCVAVCPVSGPGANMAPVGGLFYGPPVGAALGLLIAPERWQKLRVHPQTD